jgi:hypothetical protein
MFGIKVREVEATNQFTKAKRIACPKQRRDMGEKRDMAPKVKAE